MTPRLPVLLTLLLAACAAEPDAPAVATVVPDARVITLLAGEMTPSHVDTIPAGLVRLELRQSGAAVGHNVVLFALPDSGAIDAFLAAMDTLAATPSPVRALGGPEGVEGSGVADATIHDLTPGRYLIGCVMRGASGHRHLAEGEWQQLVVLPASGGLAATPVASTIDVGLADFAFVTPEEWPAGQQLLAVQNAGKQDHLMLIARLYPGKTLADYIAAEDSVVVSDALGGVARIGPGEKVYYPIVLVPGTYVLSCLIADPATRLPHVEMGMLRTVVVR